MTTCKRCGKTNPADIHTCTPPDAREEIIRMAREAGLRWSPAYSLELGRFAALVAAAEQEACAKICEARYMGDNNREDMEARRCAAAIRARGPR